MLAEQVIQALRETCDETSQSDVARRAGVSHGTVNGFLNGRNQAENMTLGTLQRLLLVVGDRLSVEQVGKDGASGPLLRELGELWRQLSHSSRLLVLATARAEAERCSSDGSALTPSHQCTGRAGRTQRRGGW
jgi:transcriptional regulator with XRE-family HTH domain